MLRDRRSVLGVVFGLLVLVTAALLADVLGTVFFAVTVAYLLLPLHDALTRRGLSRWRASLVATAAAAAAVVVLALPLVVVVASRVEAIVSVISSLPPAVTLDLYGFSTTVTLAETRSAVVTFGRRLARSFVVVVPVLSLKLTVFAMVVFALLSRSTEAARAGIAVVPPAYRDVVRALNRRTRSTLFAIYVLQAATAVGTFVVGLAVFGSLGYSYFLTLAVLAAVLQFLPIVGPSLLLAVLAAGHLVGGDVTQAVLVAGLGGVLVAWLPDVLIRPRLARETVGLPGSLYFVGFVGGLLTLGPVGIVAGPLAIALVVEMGELLSAELNDVPLEED